MYGDLGTVTWLLLLMLLLLALVCILRFSVTSNACQINSKLAANFGRRG